jgi:hypothetical protein
MDSEKEIESVYKSAFFKIDKRLKQDDASGGCTSICAIITPNSIIIANLGSYYQHTGSFSTTPQRKLNISANLKDFHMRSFACY